jgi:hypothetical protein
VVAISLQDNCHQLGIAAIGQAIREARQTLRSLQLVNCSLTTRDLLDHILAMQLPNLTQLDLSFNAISELPLGVTRNLDSLMLQHLNLSHNQLRSTPGLQHFGVVSSSAASGSLTLLDLSYNQLTSWQREDGPRVARLQLLDLDHNNISSIGASALVGILAFDVSGIFDRTQRLRMQGNPSTCRLGQVLRENNATQAHVACNCSNGLLAPMCPKPFQITCDWNNTAAISSIQICDGLEDCPSGIDERSCSTKLDLLKVDGANGLEQQVCNQKHIEDSELVIKQGVVILNWLSPCMDILCETPIAAMINFSYAEGLASLSPVLFQRPTQAGTSLVTLWCFFYKLISLLQRC